MARIKTYILTGALTAASASAAAAADAEASDAEATDEPAASAQAMSSRAGAGALDAIAGPTVSRAGRRKHAIAGFAAIAALLVASGAVAMVRELVVCLLMFSASPRSEDGTIPIYAKYDKYIVIHDKYSP